MSRESVRAPGDAFLMETSEWLELAAVLRDRWPHSRMPAETVEQWGLDLRDLRPEHVAAAIEVLYREQREHLPNPGQIRAKIVELALDAPEWSQAIAALRAIASTPTSRMVDPGLRVEEDGHEVADPVIEYPRREAIAEAHPVLGGFIEALGWEQVAVGASMEATTTAEAQLREKWNAYIRRIHREATYAGLPSVGLRRLERIAREEPRQLGSVIADVRGELEEGKAA